MSKNFDFQSTYELCDKWQTMLKHILGTKLHNARDMALKGRQHRQILTASQARNIIFALAQGVPPKRLARIHSVKNTTISNIAHGRDWRHLQPHLQMEVSIA